MLKYRVEWTLMVIAPPLMFIAVGIKLMVEAYLFIGIMTILMGVALGGVFGKFHRIGRLGNYVKSPTPQKILIFSMLAVVVGLLAALPILLRLFGGQGGFESYFRSLSIWGKISVIAGYILVLPLIILWENFRTKRRDAKELLKRGQETKEGTD